MDKSSNISISSHQVHSSSSYGAYYSSSTSLELKWTFCYVSRKRTGGRWASSSHLSPSLSFDATFSSLSFWLNFEVLKKGKNLFFIPFFSLYFPLRIFQSLMRCAFKLNCISLSLSLSLFSFRFLFLLPSSTWCRWSAKLLSFSFWTILYVKFFSLKFPFTDFSYSHPHHSHASSLLIFFSVRHQQQETFLYLFYSSFSSPLMMRCELPSWKAILFSFLFIISSGRLFSSYSPPDSTFGSSCDTQFPEKSSVKQFQDTSSFFCKSSFV